MIGIALDVRDPTAHIPFLIKMTLVINSVSKVCPHSCEPAVVFILSLLSSYVGGPVVGVGS
jgi:hypothetical protein